MPSLDGFKQCMATARRSFPDVCGTVEPLLAEGELVTGRVTWRGTQAGPFAGAAPTGQSVAFEAYHIARFEGGTVAEWWGTADIFGALAQLGVLPGPE
jgi:predicted ester cyclase